MVSLEIFNDLVDLICGIHQKLLQKFRESQKGKDIGSLSFLTGFGNGFKKNMSLKNSITISIGSLKTLEEINLNSKYSIVEAFHECIPHFNNYTNYINSYSISSQLIRLEMEKNPKFKQFIIDLHKDDFFKGYEIRGLFISPIQRLPRYCLLFDQLLSNTPKDHFDYQIIKETIYTMEQTNNLLNHKKGVWEAEKMLWKLKNIFPDIISESDDSPIEEKRIYTKGGKLLYKSSCSEIFIEMEAYLFTDYLLLSSKTKQKEIKDNFSFDLLGNEIEKVFEGKDKKIEYFYLPEVEKFKKTSDSSFEFVFLDEKYEFKEEEIGTGIAWINKIETNIKISSVIHKKKKDKTKKESFYNAMETKIKSFFK